FFFSSRGRHTSFSRDWSSDVCSSDLVRGPTADSGIETALLVRRSVRTRVEALPPGRARIRRRATAPFTEIRLLVELRVFVKAGRRTGVRLATLVLVEGTRMRRFRAARQPPATFVRERSRPGVLADFVKRFIAHVREAAIVLLASRRIESV